MLKQMLEAATGFSTRRPALVALGALVLTALGLWVFTARLAVVTDTDSMIDPALEYRQTYAAFQDAYPQLGDTLVIAIESDVPELRQRAAEALAARLADDKAHVTSVFAPQALAFFQNNGLLLLNYDDVADRMDALIAAQPVLGPMLRDPSLALLLNSLAEAWEAEPTEGDAALLETITSNMQQAIGATLDDSPYVLSLQKAALADEDPAPILIVVQPKLDPARVNPAKAALAAIRGHMDAVNAALPAPVALSMTGKIALNTEELRSVSSGAALAGGLSLLLVAGILYWGTRSVRAALAMVITLFSGLVLTGASALLIFGALNIISVAFAVLFIGLGIDFAIHLLLRARETVDEAGMASALVRASGTSGLALAICAPTTALAFLSFTPTDYAGLAQLGVIAAIGVFVAFFTALTVLPALLVLLKVSPRPAGTRTSEAGPGRAGWVLVVTLIALPLAIYLALQVGFSADPVRLKDPSTPSVQTYERLLESPRFSPYTLQLTAPSAQAADALAAEANSLDAVGRALWLGSFVPEEQQDKIELLYETYDLLAADLISDAPPAAVDINQATAALTRLAAAKPSQVFSAFLDAAANQPTLWQRLADRTLQTIPDLRQTLKRQLTSQGVTLEDVPQALAARYQGADGSYRVELFPQESIRTEAGLSAFVDEVRGTFPSVTGSPVQIVESGRIVQGAMVQATFIALGLVTAFLLLVLRSLVQVLLVLIPVALAGVFTLASAVLLGLNFNFANVIVLPLLLGLGVDAGIHYVKRAFEEGRGKTAEVGSTGRAVLLSALTTIGSFGTLMVSGHAGTASMGQLLTLALAWLLVTTLVILPALISVWVGRRRA